MKILLLRRINRVFLAVIALLLALSAVANTYAAGPRIDVLNVKGTINPVLVDYIKRGITEAEINRAEAVIIQLDTPGGLDTAMRDIVQTMVNARVPVVVYVSPSGARAASAGVFITMAAHIAVMSPNTAIGAAHPVSGSGEEIPETMAEKVVNDAAAYIRSIAGAHGRNMEWAEKAVRESVSASEQEALQLKVIDMVAPDLKTLVTMLDGRKVTMLGGAEVTLQTQGAILFTNQMKLIEDFLYTIADPNIAYLLLSLASAGIMVEIFNPGLIFPGVVGAISLLLAFYALGVLPVNWAGVLLIFLAVGMFVAEAFVPGFGLLAGGGIISLIIGSLILFKGASPLFQVNPWLIATVTIILSALIIFVVSRAVTIHRKQATTGKEELPGKTAVARTALKPDGIVFFKGERWEAVSDSGRIESGEEVVISRVDGLILHVTKRNKGAGN
ncbi:MAG: nodulation protein NfeD [Dehalococcoidales bacterium]|nr:nodulation protein NfeD [Dehalococcoidales bacterium]